MRNQHNLGWHHCRLLLALLDWCAWLVVQLHHLEQIFNFFDCVFRQGGAEQLHKSSTSLLLLVKNAINLLAQNGLRHFFSVHAASFSCFLSNPPTAANCFRRFSCSSLLYWSHEDCRHSWLGEPLHEVLHAAESTCHCWDRSAVAVAHRPVSTASCSYRPTDGEATELKQREDS
jgi:hypothetical protein